MKKKIEIPYEVEDVAQKVILMYFQHWGQKLEDRVNALNAAVAFAGIKAKFSQDGTTSGWWIASELDGIRAKKFKADLEECWPLGKFEEERDAVANLIMRTKGGQDEE
jgi:hypothetical protein